MIEKNLVVQHLKSDGEEVEDALIEQYIASAVSICEGFCNRKFYADATAADADAVVAMADMLIAEAEYNAAIEESDSCTVDRILGNRFIEKRGKILARCNGIVVDDTIRAAILMVTGHLYRNRQEVVTGQGAAAVHVPMGAQRILQPYLWIGELV